MTLTDRRYSECHGLHTDSGRRVIRPHPGADLEMKICRHCHVPYFESQRDRAWKLKLSRDRANEARRTHHD